MVNRKELMMIESFWQLRRTCRRKEESENEINDNQNNSDDINNEIKIKIKNKIISEVPSEAIWELLKDSKNPKHQKELIRILSSRIDQNRNNNSQNYNNPLSARQEDRQNVVVLSSESSNHFALGLFGDVNRWTVVLEKLFVPSVSECSDAYERFNLLLGLLETYYSEELKSNKNKKNKNNNNIINHNMAAVVRWICKSQNALKWIIEFLDKDKDNDKDSDKGRGSDEDNNEYQFWSYNSLVSFFKTLMPLETALQEVVSALGDHYCKSFDKIKNKKNKKSKNINNCYSMYPFSFRYKFSCALLSAYCAFAATTTECSLMTFEKFFNSTVIPLVLTPEDNNKTKDIKTKDNKTKDSKTKDKNPEDDPSQILSFWNAMAYRGVQQGFNFMRTDESELWQRYYSIILSAIEYEKHQNGNKKIDENNYFVYSEHCGSATVLLLEHRFQWVMNQKDTFAEVICSSPLLIHKLLVVADRMNVLSFVFRLLIESECDCENLRDPLIKSICSTVGARTDPVQLMTCDDLLESMGDKDRDKDRDRDKDKKTKKEMKERTLAVIDLMIIWISHFKFSSTTWYPVSVRLNKLKIIFENKKNRKYLTTGDILNQTLKRLAAWEQTAQPIVVEKFLAENNNNNENNNNKIIDDENNTVIKLCNSTPCLYIIPDGIIDSKSSDNENLERENLAVENNEVTTTDSILKLANNLLAEKMNKNKNVNNFIFEYSESANASLKSGSSIFVANDDKEQFAILVEFIINKINELSKCEYSEENIKKRFIWSYLLSELTDNRQIVMSFIQVDCKRFDSLFSELNFVSEWSNLLSKNKNKSILVTGLMISQLQTLKNILQPLQSFLKREKKQFEIRFEFALCLSLHLATTATSLAKFGVLDTMVSNRGVMCPKSLVPAIAELVSRSSQLCLFRNFQSFSELVASKFGRFLSNIFESLSLASVVARTQKDSIFLMIMGINILRSASVRQPNQPIRHSLLPFCSFVSLFFCWTQDPLLQNSFCPSLPHIEIFVESSTAAFKRCSADEKSLMLSNYVQFQEPPLLNPQLQKAKISAFGSLIGSDLLTGTF